MKKIINWLFTPISLKGKIASMILMYFFGTSDTIISLSEFVTKHILIGFVDLGLALATFLLALLTTFDYKKEKQKESV